MKTYTSPEFDLIDGVDNDILTVLSSAMCGEGDEWDWADPENGYYQR